jgi:hypothetical protein
MKRILEAALLLLALCVAAYEVDGRGGLPAGNAGPAGAERAIQAMHVRLDKVYAKQHAAVARLEKHGKIRTGKQHDRELARRCNANSDWVFGPIYGFYHVGAATGRFEPAAAEIKDSQMAAAFKRHESRN